MLARRFLQSRFIRPLSTMGGSQSNEAASEYVKTTISNDCVVMFSKTTCGYCRMAKGVLDSTGTNYTVVEVNKRHDGPQIQDALRKLTGMGTVPQVFIAGKCIGGGTETKKLHQQGKLLPLLEGCNNAAAGQSKL